MLRWADKLARLLQMAQLAGFKKIAKERLFNKRRSHPQFKLNPDTAQSSIAINFPVPLNVTYIVRMSLPPKHRFVGYRSGSGMCLVRLPSGETTVMPPCSRVAT